MIEKNHWLMHRFFTRHCWILFFFSIALRCSWNYANAYRNLLFFSFWLYLSMFLCELMSLLCIYEKQEKSKLSLRKSVKNSGKIPMKIIKNQGILVSTSRLNPQTSKKGRKLLFENNVEFALENVITTLHWKREHKRTTNAKVFQRT